MTRSTIARIIRHGIAVGHLAPTDGPISQAAYVRGFLRGRAMRLGIVR